MREKTKKSDFKILGINIWKLFVYFIFYSFLGYIIETLFALVTMGVWECRQSFLYGPFLGIYGVGAVVIILFAQYFTKNNFTLFLGGYLIGSITEYIVSFGTETLIGTRWWDYSGKLLNINGRICLLYSAFWGILTVFMIRKVNPNFDKLCIKIREKISVKVLKIVISIMMIFLAVDCIATVYAQDQFIARMVMEYNIPMQEQHKFERMYNKTKKNQFLNKFINTFWDNRKMIITFPNMKIKDYNGNIIYLKDLLPDIQPYYWKK